ncbi:MAG: cyclic nucleotide-binding domain-containing protein [Kiloniellaceae bacterium]
MASPCGACSVRHLTLCAALEGSELAEMSAIVSTLEFGPGDPLFDEGEPAAHVFNVTAGAVKVYKLLADGRRQVTGFLFPGDFLGLANEETYAYSAEAVTHTALCRFPRRKLENLLERFPKMERRLLGMANHELAVAQEQMLLLGRKTAREKIASFLLMLSSRAAQRGQKDNPVFVPMSRTDIGDYLGLTTETVSRTFTQLRQGAMISLLPGGKVEFVDRERLQDVAEGG